MEYKIDDSSLVDGDTERCPSMFDPSEQMVKFFRNKLTRAGKILLDNFIEDLKLNSIEKENNFALLKAKVDELQPEYGIPTIRFIEYDKFVALGKFPRYPDNSDLITPLESLDRNNSLLIFISHCWMLDDLENYDEQGRHYPDNVAGDKFQLCVNGIAHIHKRYAPEVNNCYIWMDFSCMNQDKKTKISDELERYDKVMECCDLMFTPVYDPDHITWQHMNSSVKEFSDYQAKLWCGGPSSYLFRGWCRVEMLYAAIIPTLVNTNGVKRESMFKAGLELQCAMRRRPHFVYGTKEDTSDRSAKIVRPLMYTELEEFHPMKGGLSVPSDALLIEMLINDLQKYIDSKISVGDSSVISVGESSGVRVHDSGDIYVGSFLDGKPHGFGILMSTSGDFYKGNWENGIQNGIGEFRYNNGYNYTGMVVQGKKHGPGMLTIAKTLWFEGNFMEDDIVGRGTLHLPNNCKYIGDFVSGCVHGNGRLVYEDESYYEGSFVLGRRQGPGAFVDSNGTMIIDGTWHRDIHEDGSIEDLVGSEKEAMFFYVQRFYHLTINVLSNIQMNSMESIVNGVFDGQYINGLKHGFGKLTYTDGSYFLGNFESGDKIFGTLQYANGERYEGTFKNDLFHGNGLYTKCNNDIQYRGEFLNGLPHGFGTLEDPVSIYTGSFKKGQKSGSGRLAAKDGVDYEEGIWKEDKLHGEGEKLSGGILYKGDFICGKFHGRGLLTLANGSSYEGDFENNMKHGHGQTVVENGVYEGMYVRDMKQGKGVSILKDGSRYEGDYRNNVYDGHGIYTQNNGVVYTGEFLNGQPHGYGILQDPTSVYIGHFRHGRKEGAGLLTSFDGRICAEGMWSNNEFFG